MALEFNCPYCRATIRVPDNAAGKRGRCPNCATRLTVPKRGQIQQTAEELPLPGLAGLAAKIPIIAPPNDEVVFEEFDPARAAGIDLQLQASLPPGDIALPDFGGPTPALPEMPVFPTAARQLPDAVLTHRRSRRGTPAGAWGLLVVLLAGGGGAAGTIYWIQQSSQLIGQFEAQTVEDTLPITTVPRSLVELSPDDAEVVLDHLRKNPRSLASRVGLATINFDGDRRGLLVTVLPGSATAVYRVEILSDQKLQNFLRSHAQDYERIRRDHLSKSVNKMFLAIKPETESTAHQPAATDLQEFRDSVGFTASVQGLGYFVAAAYHQQMYPCVHEDDEALYFLLPRDADRFQIRGNPARRDEAHFPGVYDVTVTGSVKLRPHEDLKLKPVTKKTKKTESDEESMSEDNDEAEMSSEEK